MPGSNAGTGQPLNFRCHIQRLGWYWGYRHPEDERRPILFPTGHENITRTGRTRDNQRGGIRMMNTAHEYRCECGHVGWSKHHDVLRCPLEKDSP